jgi:hypothetical protein
VYHIQPPDIAARLVATHYAQLLAGHWVDYRNALPAYFLCLKLRAFVLTLYPDLIECMAVPLAVPEESVVMPIEYISASR